MREYIKKIQSKSEDTRKVYFTGSLIIVMSFVGIIWATSFGARLGSPSVKEQAREDIKPFKLFGDSLSSTYENISASVGNIKKIDETKVEEEKQIDLIPVEYPSNQ